jgi:hypothetical protein
MLTRLYLIIAEMVGSLISDVPETKPEISNYQYSSNPILFSIREPTQYIFYCYI